MTNKTEQKEKNAVHLLPWVTAVAMFIQSLDGTILNTSLPSIARDMAYSPTQMHSVIVTYAYTGNVYSLIRMAGG